MADNLADRKASLALMELLEHVSDAEMRAIGVEALRRWRLRETKNARSERERLDDCPCTVFQLNAIGRDIVDLLVERKGAKKPNLNLHEPFVDDAALFRSWMSPFVEFIWWLVRAGLAVEHTYGYKMLFNDAGQPIGRYNNESPLHVFPVSMRLTSRGVRLIDGDDDDPLLPGFLDRVKQRCTSLPEGVIALLVDARACLDRRLNRPAVVLMGVAYELAIEEVIPNLATKNFVKPDTIKQQAGERIARIRAFVTDDKKLEMILPKSDDRRAVVDAYDFAERLRQRRNDAAHTRPAFDFEHDGECEEFIVSAGRHLPALWMLSK
jgi:hypothetical protein